MKLLVSVRNLAEATVAQRCCVDIIDIKEPDRGSLGSASQGTIASVARQFGQRCVLSAACGELLDEPKPLVDLPSSLAFAKIGLFGCAGQKWQSRWNRWADGLPVSVQPVMVGYADHLHCHAPDLYEVLEHAVRTEVSTILIDTHLKDGRQLLDYISLSRLRDFVRQVHRHKMECAIAGSISKEHSTWVSDLKPDIVAVRGSACRLGDRRLAICEQRIRQLYNLICEAKPVS